MASGLKMQTLNPLLSSDHHRWNANSRQDFNRVNYYLDAFTNYLHVLTQSSL